MSRPSPNVWKVGAEQLPPRPRSLRAGPLRLEYEGGFLRDLRCGRCEALRMINFALRDENWGTLPFHIEKESVSQQTDSFQIAYQAVFQGDPAPFVFNVAIAGHPDGSVHFEIEGRAKRTFRANRAGFTVLHPLAECAGQPLTVLHPDGSEERIRFPEQISPHQPAFDIQGMRWTLPNGARARLAFEGEVFEMEDQRNWTDASFKTYCTPLSRPFPVELAPGDSVRQRILFTLDAIPSDPQDACSAPTTLIPVGDPAPLLKRGVAASSQTGRLSSTEIDRIKELDLSAYRIDVALNRPDWTERWETEAANAKALGLPVELVLIHSPEEAPSDEALARIADSPAPIASLCLFPQGAKTSSTTLLSQEAPRLRRHFPKTRIGSGTDAFFAELNRDRAAAAPDADFVVFSVNPQVHASDLRSIAETLEALPATLLTARSFSGRKPIHISPLSLKMRWNPNATASTSAPDDPTRLPDDADPRQATVFAAAWTLGALAQLAQSGADSVTLFETVGEKGIMHLQDPTAPDRFPAPPGSLFPVYFLLRELNGARFIQPIKPSSPTPVQALWIQHPQQKLILANPSDRSAEIALPPPFRNSRLVRLEAETFDPFDRSGPTPESFQGDTLAVPPFAILVARAD